MDQIERFVGREVPVIMERAGPANPGRTRDRVSDKVIAVVRYLDGEVTAVLRIRRSSPRTVMRILAFLRARVITSGPAAPTGASRACPKNRSSGRAVKGVLSLDQRNGPLFDPAPLGGRMEQLARPCIGPCRDMTAIERLDGQQDRRTVHDLLPGLRRLGRRNARPERKGTTRRCPPPRSP